MTTLGGFGMVMYVTMLMCLVLVEQICYAAAAEEQVPKLATANTSTTWYRDHVRNITATHITYDHMPPIAYSTWSPRSRSIQVKVEGFWSVLLLLKKTLAKYLNVEQRAHWLPIQERTNQLWRDNDVIMSYWVRSNRLRHLDFHARTLYIGGTNQIFCAPWAQPLLTALGILLLY